MTKNWLHKLFNPLNLNISLYNLHFRDKTTEKKFAADYQEKSISQILLFMCLGIILYGAFNAINDAKYRVWFFCMMAIVVILAVSVNFKFFRKYQNLSFSIFTLVIGVSYIITMSDAFDDHDLLDLSTNFMGLLLILFAINSFIRLKFGYMIFINLVMFVLYLLFGIFDLNLLLFDPSYYRYTSLILFSTVLIGSLAIYNIEYLYRKDYIQRTTIQRQAEKLREANLDMEKKVLERTKELEVERTKSVRAILEGQEIERQRIAQDLHDSLNIRLIGHKRTLEAILPENSKQSLAEIDAIINQVREISHNLLPYSLKHLGLIKAIEDLCSRLEKNHRFKVSFEKINISENDRWNTILEIEIYRVIQEVVADIIKHASASTIHIEIIADNDIVYISVEDNGIGFDYNQCKNNGIGLSNINTRINMLNGSVNYDSRINNGTMVMINIPLSA
jgi:signal transduction histidine kinase